MNFLLDKAIASFEKVFLFSKPYLALYEVTHILLNLNITSNPIHPVLRIGQINKSSLTHLGAINLFIFCLLSASLIQSNMKASQAKHTAEVW